MKQRVDVKWLLGVAALLGAAGCGAAETGEGEPVASQEEHFDVEHFTGWQSVVEPGSILAPPAVLNVDGNLNNIEIYGTGTDNAVWYASRTSTTAPWQGWFRLGGVVISKPAVTMFRTDRKAIVGLDSDKRVQIAVTVGGGSGYGPFAVIPKPDTFVGAPAVAYLAPHLYVVARKSDNVVYFTRNDVSLGLNNNNWSAWQGIPGGLLSSEPAITSGFNRVLVAARGQDNRIWITGTTSNPSWSAWKPVGNDTFKGAPAISVHNGGVAVTARGAHNFLYVAAANAATGATDGWDVITGITTGSGPGTAANPNGTGRFGVAGRLGNGFVRFNLWEPQ